MNPIKQIIKYLPDPIINILRVFRQKTRTMLGKENTFWSRVVMNKATLQIVESLPYKDMDAIEISGNYWGKMHFKSYQSLNYPQFDICSEQLSIQPVDIILAEQVFEHITKPYRAVRNVYQMLKPNGFFIVTTPFLLKIHNHPVDCSRWSEIGLKYLLIESGFSPEKIKTASWGNKDCVIANLEEWVLWDPAKHSLENQPEFPIMVWAIAQK